MPGAISQERFGNSGAGFLPVDNTPGEAVLSGQHLSAMFAFNRKDISFDVREGGSFGTCGLVGAGRTGLPETLFGVRAHAALCACVIADCVFCIVQF